MDPEPFKNEDGSICKKKKIRFIQARIKPSIYNKIKYIRALSQITTYADFKRAVLNAKDIIRNQTSSGKNLGGY